MSHPARRADTLFHDVWLPDETRRGAYALKYVNSPVYQGVPHEPPFFQ